MPHLKLNVIDVAARQKEQDCSIHGINLYRGIQIETPPSIPAETGHRPERPGTGKRTTLNHEMPGCKLAIVHCCAGMLVVILCCCLATFVPWSVIFIYYFILLIDMWRAVLSHQGCPLLLAPVGTFFFFFPVWFLASIHPVPKHDFFSCVVRLCAIVIHKHNAYLFCHMHCVPVGSHKLQCPSGNLLPESAA